MNLSEGLSERQNLATFRSRRTGNQKFKHLTDQLKGMLFAKAGKIESVEAVRKLGALSESKRNNIGDPGRNLEPWRDQTVKLELGLVFSVLQVQVPCIANAAVNPNRKTPSLRCSMSRYPELNRAELGRETKVMTCFRRVWDLKDLGEESHIDEGR